MRSLLSFGRARGTVARIVDGRRVGAAGAVGLPVRGRLWDVRAALVLLAAALGALLVFSAPALAAAPEAPEISVETPVPAHSATVRGVLDPKNSGEAGTYEFLYAEGKAGCAGGTKVPEPAGLMTGAKGEPAPPEVLSLNPHTEYTVCLRVETTGGSAESSVVFVTAAAPPEVLSESAGPDTVLGQKSPGEGFEFYILQNEKAASARVEYSAGASGGTLDQPVTTVSGSLYPQSGTYGIKAYGLAETGPVLHPDRTYYYRVAAENEQSRLEGKPAFGEIQKFTTAPETPETSTAGSVSSRSATLRGVLNPGTTVPSGEAGTYGFVYRQSASERKSANECQGEGETATPLSSASGGEKQAVSAEVTGLLPGTEYTFCVLARNVAEEVVLGAPVTFTTMPVAPVIEEESYSSLGATELRLEGKINPGGGETSYRFEYGSAAGSYDASVPVPAGEVAAGTNSVIVKAVATGLLPATSYHYRLVASNAAQSGVAGPDQMFTTPAAQGTGSPPACPNEQLRAEQPFGLRLPDCRAYEMVSPLETEGQDATDPFLPSRERARASVSGEALTYVSAGSFADPVGAAYRDQLLSQRGPNGWSNRSINPPTEAYEADLVKPYEGFAFTPELTKGLTTEVGRPLAGAPEGPEELYLADFADNSYQWLSNTPDPDPKWVSEGEGIVLGASADLSHVVFVSANDDGFIPMNEWVNGKIIVADVTNTGETMNAGLGTFSPGEGGLGQAGSGRPSTGDTWQAVSADGSRVFFTSYGMGNYSNGEEQLYARVNVEQPQSPMDGDVCEVPTDACTIEVSRSQRVPADPHGEWMVQQFDGSVEQLPRPARYWGASANGSKVLFTSSVELTDNAYTGPEDNAPNLYEYDVETGKLVDLTVDTRDTDGAAVLGVSQISEDGSYVYFVAKGALAAGAVAGSPNLYVSHEGGAPRFIATLGDDLDILNWNGEHLDEERETQEFAGPEVNSAVVTPDGSQLAFVSDQDLTGYDNEQAEPGECEQYVLNSRSGHETGKCREVYLYNAETNSLVCASCNPSGARPIGPSGLVTHEGDGRSPNEGAETAEYRPRNLVEGGTLFFDSSDALVPHASDGRQNVYEYEDGHVYPISNVAGGFGSFFLDASANGENVFFGTADQLLPQDTSNSVVVYDARVGGGFPVTVAPPPCDNGDSCKPPPAAQPSVFGAPGSATFSGAGNIAPTVVAKPVAKTKAKTLKCKKGEVKKRGKCVKKPKSRKAKKSTHGKGSK